MQQLQQPQQPISQQSSSQQSITRDSTIGEIVRDHPEVIDTLLGFGVHCVGCHVSEWETLGEGFAGHGMAEPEITVALEKLNQVIQEHASEKKTGSLLNFSNLAIEKIKEICQQKNKKALRIEVRPGGCAGNSYAFSLADMAKPEEKVLSEHGIQVFLDKNTEEMMTGATIDYVDGLQGAGFKVQNPMAKKHCGCGTSFG